MYVVSVERNLCSLQTRSLTRSPARIACKFPAIATRADRNPTIGMSLEEGVFLDQILEGLEDQAEDLGVTLV